MHTAAVDDLLRVSYWCFGHFCCMVKRVVIVVVERFEVGCWQMDSKSEARMYRD